MLRRITKVARPFVRNLQAFSKVDAFTPSDVFLYRHIGPNEEETKEMLKTLKFDSLDQFTDATVPKDIHLNHDLLEGALSESEAQTLLMSKAKKNKILKSFIGQGYHETITPAVIRRNVFENPGWYTAYTPYQAEISQGRLEALLNFQTVITELTGFPMSNCSLLDEATSAAEAMKMCFDQSKGKKNKFFVDVNVFPQTLDVIRTRAECLGIEVVVGDVNTDMDLDNVCGVILQYPNAVGEVSDFSVIANKIHEAKSMLVTAVEPLSLSILKSPASFGADIAVGASQRLGIPMGFGGPSAGFLATSKKFSRKMPGRIIGITRDSRGKPALRMAMQAREQHIRRDKATSNICTAQALLASMAGMYAVYHGPKGLQDIAQRIHKMACITAEALIQGGLEIVNGKSFFDTLTVKVADADAVLANGVEKNMNFARIDDTTVSITFDEATKKHQVQDLISAFGVNVDIDSVQVETDCIESFMRDDEILTQEVFNTYHSETAMMRYLNHLERKDLSLNYSMISLGSCTMKLNAASELEPLSWPEFSNMHPHVPADQAEGYLDMIADLNAKLSEVTGFAQVSQQPNSGANGEYAGLVTIRRYFQEIGEDHRNVCLIPTSAHGTNPASASMAGMKIIPVKNDANGNIMVEDFRAKAEKYKDNLACAMITYPSTFGVFEDTIRELCEIIHENGGQVYMDGANMNAQVGLTSPGHIGADVCHLNLHKTFAIPHGGGGPGVGTIGVAEHLVKFLPGHAVVGDRMPIVNGTTGQVSASPFGSAMVLPITWMYLTMLGKDVKRATQAAIMNANYMATRLEDHYDILFRAQGANGHEFIMDFRPFKKFGITEKDVAKRLMDYGFHSPTMSWPVPGTLMCEPTESENKFEVDRLCDALIQIRGEIEDVIEGKIDPEVGDFGFIFGESYRT
eukprot:TRINITY_DN2854_c0_g1_i2.p1 TRINITY_DN2854_c0_g1~~TRINITY_DN2854_c0_g1_i2.p1  ORF type:complete len:915 (-),score=268.75 TRINITY_DN2854_c0_g1_i2:436-3180(-)